MFKPTGVRIINADCTKAIEELHDSIDLIVNSPPYNVGIEYGDHDDSINYDGYLDFSKRWLNNCYCWLKDHGRICVNVPFETAKSGKHTVYADLVKIMKEVGFSHYTTAIWTKGNVPRNTWGTWLSPKAPLLIPPAESVIIMSKGDWKREDADGRESDISKSQFIQWIDCVWKICPESKKKILHPAPFPIELPHRCIKLLTFVGDTVLDNFMGSGSTLIAAYRSGRNSIGIEISEEYCKLAKKRINREIEISKSYIF